MKKVRKSGCLLKGFPSSLMQWSISKTRHMDHWAVSVLSRSSKVSGHVVSTPLVFSASILTEKPSLHRMENRPRWQPFIPSCKNIPTGDKRWSDSLHTLTYRGKNHVASENIYFGYFKNIYCWYLQNISLQASFFFILYFNCLEIDVELNFKIKSSSKLKLPLRFLSPETSEWTFWLLPNFFQHFSRSVESPEGSLFKRVVSILTNQCF